MFLLSVSGHTNNNMTPDVWWQAAGRQLGNSWETVIKKIGKLFRTRNVCRFVLLELNLSSDWWQISGERMAFALLQRQIMEGLRITSSCLHDRVPLPVSHFSYPTPRFPLAVVRAMNNFT